MTENNKKNLSRRDALKVLGAAAGATALANLPNKWNSPELLSGVLPAHAQTSEPVCGDYMQAIAVTTTMVEGEVGEEYADFDFILCTPNGYFVWGGDSGDGATSSPDNISFSPRVDNEWLEIAGGIDGTYSIYLVNWTNDALEISVQITTAIGVYNTSLTLAPGVYTGRSLADVTFPCGNVTWRNEVMLPSCIPSEDLEFDRTNPKAKWNR